MQLLGDMEKTIGAQYGNVGRSAGATGYFDSNTIANNFPAAFQPFFHADAATATAVQWGADSTSVSDSMLSGGEFQDYQGRTGYLPNALLAVHRRQLYCRYATTCCIECSQRTKLTTIQTQRYVLLPVVQHHVWC